jgi:hypothetical protein
MGIRSETRANQGERTMEGVCPTCGGQPRFDQRLRRALCRRCGRLLPPSRPAARLLLGAEVVDWLHDQPVTHYMMAVEATPAREPSQVYLRVLRRLRWQRPHL